MCSDEMLCVRTILRDLHNLTNIHAEWRKSEAASLSALIQRRIQYLQVTFYCRVYFMIFEVFTK